MLLSAQLKIRLGVDEAQLEAWCRRWSVTELAFFGSVLRDDFRSDSDVDALMVISPGHPIGLFEHAEMAEELENILHRRVDLLTRRAVENSRNWIRRKEILDNARVIYAA